MLRTHFCGELRPRHQGEEVFLFGWVHRIRDHGGLLFFDLRDRTGLVQVVASPADGGPYRLARELGREYVVAVRGRVFLRSPETVNPKIPTGEVEVRPHEIQLLNSSRTPPFEIEDETETDELTRLRYRYLDLRRPAMTRRLAFRHRVVQAARRYLEQEGFIEVETPCLTRSTPEGARDFLVPSRLFPGTFYALPQSPQLFKQLLMVGGVDRYYQVARCFRDEDLRADRQPEFTQIDLEMSFADEEDVMAVTEGMLGAVFREALGEDLPLPFPRLTWEEALSRFGTDRPDLRIPLEIRDLSPTFRHTGLGVFSRALSAGGCVKGMRLPGGGALSRRELDGLVEEARALGAGGLAWAQIREGGEWHSPIAKFLSPEEMAEAAQRLEARPGDLVCFVAGPEREAAEALGALRPRMAELLGLPLAGPRFSFLWVTRFPLLEWSEEEGRWVSVHHPFTSPVEGELEQLEAHPERVHSRSYDLVLNGVELGGGSIRIHRRELQERIFRILGLPPEEAESRFGFLLEALEYGAPPHGGIALGLDRLVAMLSGTSSIREVMAFPKTARGTCPLTGAPAEVEESQLRELGIYAVRAGKK